VPFRSRATIDRELFKLAIPADNLRTRRPRRHVCHDPAPLLGINDVTLVERAYELGGESRPALESFRSLGPVRDSRGSELDGPALAPSVLSSHEHEVAESVAKGHSNEEISQILHISSRTAEKHVSSGLEKLNLRSRLQLERLLARSQISSD
jgi:DNA-binding CsgD family transcriptional regulator